MKLTIALLFLAVAIACTAQPKPTASNSSDAPTFNTEQKKKIVALQRDYDALQKRQQAVQQIVNDVCKPPAWQFSNQVPNADGTGTEPGCTAAPPAAKPPEPAKK